MEAHDDEHGTVSMMRQTMANLRFDESKLLRLLAGEEDAQLRPVTLLETDKNYRGPPIVDAVRTYASFRETPLKALVERARYDDRAVQPHFLPIPALRPPYRFIAWKGHVTSHVVKWNLQRIGSFEELPFDQIGDCSHVLFRLPLYHGAKFQFRGGSEQCVANHDPLRHITGHFDNLYEASDRARVFESMRAFLHAGSAVAVRLGLDADLGSVVPHTFSLSSKDDCLRFFREYDPRSSEVWVKKTIDPVMGSSVDYIGRGQISRVAKLVGGSDCSLVTDDAESEEWGQDAAAAAASSPSSSTKRVVEMQRYVRPYLLHGHKFDLRVFAYVARLDPLLVYFHEGPISLCVDEWRQETLGISTFAHVCNLATSRRHSKWQREIFTSDVVLDFHDLKREMDRAEPGSYGRMLAHIKRVIKLHLRAVAHRLVGQPGQFELFAFDFMLDNEGHPWFVNSQPTTGAHFHSAKGMWGSIIDQQLEMLHHRRLGMPEYPPVSPHTFDPVPLINDWE